MGPWSSFHCLGLMTIPNQSDQNIYNCQNDAQFQSLMPFYSLYTCITNAECV